MAMADTSALKQCPYFSKFEHAMLKHWASVYVSLGFAKRRRGIRRATVKLT
jgi:hypothetical protein